MKYSEYEDIGVETDPPKLIDFQDEYHDGKIRLSEWLPKTDFEDYANELFYLVLTGTHSQAEKHAQSVLDKAERLWEKR